MRSTKDRTVIVGYQPSVGQIPPFLALAQRHFEKDPPPLPAGLTQTLIVPLDFVRMVAGSTPPPELDEIEEITVTYSKEPRS